MGGPVLAGRHGLRSAVAAIVYPAAVTLAALPFDVSTEVAALAYVLAVMGAAAMGGVRAAIASAFLSFLALNFFFTEPLHTLRVEHPDDLVALGVFLVVATVVATLLSRAIEQRVRAEQREREARLLHDVGNQLLVGDPPGEALDHVAGWLVELFDLERCEVVSETSGSRLVTTDGEGDNGGVATVIPMVVQDREIGSVILVPKPGRGELTSAQRGVAGAVAAELGLALESARLRDEADRAQTDAEASTMRAALFSSVTHDLRTPLAAITASVTNLLDDEANITEADRKDHLETIREEAQRLNRLVGNILHLARTRAGAVTPQKQQASVNDVVEGVVARLQPLLDGRPIRLILRDVPDIGVDIDQLDQVLTNVIENAVRHGRPASEIVVSTARWQRWIEIRVVDHGPGIVEEDRERVFEPFSRGTSSRDGGTGLGLSIARALVEAHRGKIWIEGAPGGGTTVAFRLPIDG